MSQYTTGEVAKLCGVSVRTVQYYDTRGILAPSELSEGGRRLYSEADLQKMQIICFLRDLGMPLSSIAALFKEEHPEDVISLLLTQQKDLLTEEIAQRQAQLERLQALEKEIQKSDRFSVESIPDIARIMETKKQLKKARKTMIAVAIVGGIFEYGTLILALATGNWWPFAIAMLAVVLPLCVWIFFYYYKKIDYICPKCHGVFKPSKTQMFFAPHTYTTRKLTCRHCGHNGFCVETYSTEE